MIVATANPENVGTEIRDKFRGKFYELKSDTWFVSFDGTTRQLAEEVGIRNGTIGSGVVAPITGFSGRANLRDPRSRTLPLRQRKPRVRVEITCG
jgi:hypothetical protein